MNAQLGEEPASGPRPRVSIVIPAFQAAETIKRALDSLKAQTFTDWEAIVVDDGSSDDTFAQVQAMAARDPRIVAFRQDNRGASAARNRGLDAARGDWIGFLDSDDWFDPRFLQTLLDLSDRNPDCGVVYCDFTLVHADGRMPLQPQVPDLSDPFPVLAYSCVLTVHCALIRRDLLDRAGRFDEGLATNEDWDLWQRIARLDPGFVGVPDFLAFYYSRPKSLSRRPFVLAQDGIVVIDRMFEPDPRVIDPAPRYAEGMPLEGRAGLRLEHVLWCAGQDISVGGDGVELIPLASDADKAILRSTLAADHILGGLAFGCCGDVKALAPRWAEFEKGLDAFWAALQRAIGQGRAIDTTRFLTRLKVLGEKAFDQPFASDQVAVRRIDIARPLTDLDPGGCDAVLAGVFKGDTLLGQLEAPAEGVIPAATVRAMLLEAMPYWPERKQLIRSLGMGWSLRFWAHAAREGLAARGWGFKRRLNEPERALDDLPFRARLIMLQALRALLRDTLKAPETPAAAAEPAPVVAAPEKPAAPDFATVEANTPEYWDLVFDAADPWSYDSSYEQTKYRYTLDLIGQDRPAKALELACAEGHFTVQLAGKVGSLLATDISALALTRAAARCREHANVTYAQLDFFEQPIVGSFDLIVCSEVLYECHSMPKLQGIARNIAEHLEPGGALVMAHVIEVSEEPGRSGFDWDGVFGAKTIAEVFGKAGLTLEEQVETELYRVHRFRKGRAAQPTVYRHEPLGAPPEPKYAAYVAWGGVKVTQKEAILERALAVPVLMYHRIAAADDGPRSLARYRLAPEAFEAQLRWLRQNGYRCMTPEVLAETLRSGRPAPGRPVLLTFDDGYRDFHAAAWPILKRYGMSAAVAVVTDLVGQTAAWDSGFGPTSPLMSWDEIAEVHAEGAHIMSHSASHRGFPALSGREALVEASRSWTAIHDAIGEPPAGMVYPYGAFDPLAARACSAAGYRLGLGTERGAATLLSDPMHAPRIEVSGFDDLDAFVDKLTRIDPRTGVFRRDPP